MGKVHMWAGSVTGPVNNWTVTGSSANDLLGYTISPAGDINEDGFDDFLMMNPSASKSGTITLYLGAQNGPRMDTQILAQGAIGENVGLNILSGMDIDGDGMGRAFPELQMVSMTMHNIAACPMVMADEKGNSLVLNTVDNLSTEKFARVITVEMGGAGLIALYPMSGVQAKKSILKGSMSLINAIGRIIHEEQLANRNPADKLSRELNGIRIFEGLVKDVERRTEGGFARGKCSIEGLGKDQGCLLYTSDAADE